MKRNYNEMTFFNYEDAMKLINFLIDYNKSDSDRMAVEDSGHYNDIHIYQEENLIVVQWSQVPYSHEWGGVFKFVDEDQEVVTSFSFPDGSTGYEFSEGEKEDMLEDWLKDNPGWHKDFYGRWVKEDEE